MMRSPSNAPSPRAHSATIPITNWVLCSRTHCHPISGWTKDISHLPHGQLHPQTHPHPQLPPYKYPFHQAQSYLLSI